MLKVFDYFMDNLIQTLKSTLLNWGLLKLSLSVHTHSESH